MKIRSQRLSDESGCGKVYLFKTLNRMNDLVPNVTINGKVWIDGEDIYDPKVDTTLLRKKVGMVFQQPNPFPMSIYDNIAYDCGFTALREKQSWTRLWRRVCAARLCGMRSRIA